MASRTYEQYCPLSLALDAVGERWTLLIVRELLGGPKRYTDLRAGLGGISPTLLATRLAELEASGLVTQKDLPPPAARRVYVLTEDGRRLTPVLGALIRWGMERLPEPDGTTRPRPAMTVQTTLFAYLDPARCDIDRRVYQLTIDDETFTFHLDGNDVQLSASTPAFAPDLHVTISAADLIHIRKGSLSAARAVKTGALRWEPADRSRLDEFLKIFSLQ